VNSVTAIKPAATQASPFVPSFPRELVRNSVVAVARPWLAVQLLTRAPGKSDLTTIAYAGRDAARLAGAEAVKRV
jgi:hypothetical protein